MKIIAGLGNPTDQYKGTRHNVGFMAIDKICEKYKITMNQHKFKALTGNGVIGGQRVILLKPLTYMNLSGESLRAAADFYKVPLEDILVIYDDISLEPGMMRIRKKGSAGGHNGMKSIITHLGGDTFPRIRVGIGGEKHPGMDLADYVLGHFTKEEQATIDEILDKAACAAELIMAEEIDEAMNKYSVGKKSSGKSKVARRNAKRQAAQETENSGQAETETGVKIQEAEKAGVKSPEAEKVGVKSPEAEESGAKSPEAEKAGAKSPEAEKVGAKSPEAEKVVVNVPRAEDGVKSQTVANVAEEIRNVEESVNSAGGDEKPEVRKGIIESIIRSFKSK